VNFLPPCHFVKKYARLRFVQCKVWSSRTGIVQDAGLQRCYTVSVSEWFLTFWSDVMPSSWRVKQPRRICSQVAWPLRPKLLGCLNMSGTNYPVMQHPLAKEQIPWLHCKSLKNCTNLTSPSIPSYLESWPRKINSLRHTEMFHITFISYDLTVLNFTSFCSREVIMKLRGRCVVYRGLPQNWW
jgi:hypothetical protein